MTHSSFAFRLCEGPLHGPGFAHQIEGDDAGCVVEFRGTVRGKAGDREVLRLEYDAYPEMVEAELRRIVEEVRSQHAILRVAIEHSSGTVPVGGCSVRVWIASAHRAAAFAAAAMLMDELKQRVPIWKKEVYADGGVWLGRGS